MTATTLTKTNPAAALKTSVQEIITLMTAFTKLLTSETQALRKCDFATVDTLQEGKRALAAQYQEKITVLATHRESIASLDLPLRNKLMAERERFNTVLDENMHALDLAQNSTKRLVNRILEAARAAVVENNQTNYGGTGKAMTYKSASMSLNVNSVL